MVQPNAKATSKLLEEVEVLAQRADEEKKRKGFATSKENHQQKSVKFYNEASKSFSAEQKAITLHHPHD